MKFDKLFPRKFSLDNRLNDELFSAREERKITILFGTAITLLLLMLSLKFISALDYFNHTFTSLQIAMLPRESLSPLPVIVEVDEKSLALFGQWPWPRYRVARLLTEIQNAGAAAVGIDAVFVERDRTSPIEIQRTVKQDFNSTFSLTALDSKLVDYDAMLGQALASGPFVLSYFFTYDNSGQNDCVPRSASAAWLSGKGQSRPFLQTTGPTGILCNLPVIQQSARYNGFINATPDDDGLFRKTPLLILFKDRLLPSLALQTYLTAKKMDRIVLSDTDAGFMLKAEKLAIPLDQAGNLTVKFPNRGQHFDRISAADILKHKIDDSRLRDRIVLIGFSATGLHEVRPTPYDPKFLGVEIHASVLDNLLRQDFLHRPGYAQNLELAVATLIGFTLFIGLAGAGPVPIAMAPVLVIALLMSGSQFLLAHSGIILSPALPVLMAILTFLALTLIKYARESLHTRQMNLMITQAQEGIIQSFSSMSEFRDPETGAHIKRTQNYVRVLALHLKNHPNFQGQLTDETIELFFKAAPLHDIGKVGIRDSILLKPSHLGMDEFEIMKSHPQIGADIIEAVAAQCGWNAFMRIAHQICLSHHEKWDGSGYPLGLAGAAIPLSARLMMLADVYDALISKRVYKPPFSHNQARTLIEKGKGNHFDPVVVEAFLAIENQFIAIALEHLDSEDQRQTLLDSHLPAEPN